MKHPAPFLLQQLPGKRTLRIRMPHHPIGISSQHLPPLVISPDQPRNRHRLRPLPVRPEPDHRHLARALIGLQGPRRCHCPPPKPPKRQPAHRSRPAKHKRPPAPDFPPLHPSSRSIFRDRTQSPFTRQRKPSIQPNSRLRPLDSTYPPAVTDSSMPWSHQYKIADRSFPGSKIRPRFSFEADPVNQSPSPFVLRVEERAQPLFKRGINPCRIYATSS